jgi:hypothetical protein
LPLSNAPSHARACKHSTSNCAGRIATRLRPTCRQTWLVVTVGLAFVPARFDRQRVGKFTALLPSAVERRAFADSCGHTAICRRSCDVPTDSPAASERYPCGVHASVRDVAARCPLSSQSVSDRAASSSPRGGVSVLAHFGFLRCSEGRLHSLVSRGGRQAFPINICAKVRTSLVFSVAVSHPDRHSPRHSQAG